MADPRSDTTFHHSKLDFSEVDRHRELYALHRDLLRLRREDAVLSRQGADGMDGAVLSGSAFVIRFFSPGFSSNRLLVVNLGIELDLSPSPEPLLACPGGARWKKLWSSDDSPYGGSGTPAVDADGKLGGPGPRGASSFSGYHRQIGHSSEPG